MDTITASPTARRFTALAALGAALLLLAVPRTAVADPEEDSAYEQRSVAMQMANAGELVEAGDYLVRMAAELDEGDEEKDDNLRLAARLYHHAGALDDAWRAMVNAGVAAYRLGDAVRAGHDLVDATVVAVQAGNSIRAWDTADRVGYVLRTADLLPEERLAILERIQVQQRNVIRG